MSGAKFSLASDALLRPVEMFPSRSDQQDSIENRTDRLRRPRGQIPGTPFRIAQILTGEPNTNRREEDSLERVSGIQQLAEAP
jgi:hypothetical protein